MNCQILPENPWKPILRERGSFTLAGRKDDQATKPGVECYEPGSSLRCNQQDSDFAGKGDFYRFEPGETVVCRQGKGWVYGRIQMLRP